MAPFFGHIENLRDSSGIVQGHVPRTREVSTLPVGSAVAFQGFAGFFHMNVPETTTANTTETSSMLDFPGVAVLTVESNAFQLSTGLIMDWVTERP